MSAKPFTAEKSGVILIRMGVGREEHALPEGATLAKVLQMTQVDTEGQSIYVDGKPLEEYVILQPGMIVTIVPRAKNATNKERWSETIGMFKDDPTFQEFVDRVQTRRDRERGKA